MDKGQFEDILANNNLRMVGYATYVDDFDDVIYTANPHINDLVVEDNIDEVLLAIRKAGYKAGFSNDNEFMAKKHDTIKAEDMS